jgi:hypothetical protein
MRFLLIGLLLIAPPAAASAGTPLPQQTPKQARTCPQALAKLVPRAPARMQKLNQLPPAETYAAVYYSDGCPRRLIEARGQTRR